MVSIGKLNFEQAMRYYESDVEQYYAGQNDESFYGGKANKLLGESVAEHKGSFSKFLSKNRKVAGIDLTFSAPKSVSILIELTDDPILRDKLIEMHDNAVCKTIGYIEKNVITARVFNGKDEKGRRKYVPVPPDKGVEWAAFRHHTSRENDPQLHTHVVVANRIYVNGREYSIDSRDLYEYHIAFGKMYRAELYNALQKEGLSVKITDYKNFFFTIEGIGEEAIQVFSKQSKNMDKLLKELKKEFPDESEARLKELANLESRPAKDRSKTLEELRTHWKEESPQKRIEYVKKFGVLAGSEEVAKAVAEAAEKLTENKSVFSDLDFKNSVKQILIYKGFRFDEVAIQTALKESVKKHDLKEIGKNKFTTKEIRMAEFQTQNHARDTHNKFESILNKEDAVKAIKAWEEKKRLDDPKFKGLTNDQRKTLEMMLTTKDGVMIFQGDAGTGKTTVLRALNDICKERGFELIGLSFQGKAAQEIYEASGIKGMTLDSFLSIMRGKKNIEINNKKIYIVDESSMTATLKFRDVSLYAKREGAKMFAGGDIKQLPSIQAGGMFERMQKSENISFVELKESIRQKDPVLKAIVKHFAESKALKGLKAMDAAGKIHEIKDKDNLFQAITDAYVAEGDKNNIILAAKNKDRFIINQITREKLKQKGLLDAEDFKIKIKEGKNLNDYDKKQIWSYDEKDIIVRGKDKTHEYEVKNVDIDGRMLTAYDRNNDKEISMAASKDQRVYYEVEKNFSKGDKIVFLENDYAHLDVRNGQTAIIDDIAKLDNGNYKIDATTMSDNPKKVSFETKDYDFFTHAYCVTTYKSQGLTAAKIWAYAVDTTLNEMYVNISRAKYNAEVFTTNIMKLFGTSKKVDKQVDSLTQEGRERFKEEQVKKMKENGIPKPEKKAKKEKGAKKEFEPAADIKPERKRGGLDIS